ncbi:MAG: hypothetical protein LAT63_15225 [Marinobacter sp.]|nr:hypothetical protein [Marinobacter sp.]
MKRFAIAGLLIIAGLTSVSWVSANYYDERGNNGLQPSYSSNTDHLYNNNIRRL